MPEYVIKGRVTRLCNVIVIAEDPADAKQKFDDCDWFDEDITVGELVDWDAEGEPELNT